MNDVKKNHNSSLSSKRTIFLNKLKELVYRPEIRNVDFVSGIYSITCNAKKIVIFIYRKISLDIV